MTPHSLPHVFTAQTDWCDALGKEEGGLAGNRALEKPEHSRTPPTFFPPRTSSKNATFVRPSPPSAPKRARPWSAVPRPVVFLRSAERRNSRASCGARTRTSSASERRTGWRNRATSGAPRGSVWNGPERPGTRRRCPAACEPAPPLFCSGRVATRRRASKRGRSIRILRIRPSSTSSEEKLHDVDDQRKREVFAGLLAGTLFLGWSVGGQVLQIKMLSKCGAL